jgi:ADP-ribosylglycohydrolase
VTQTGSVRARTKSTRGQYLGCLLGGAVGDALGADVEFLSLSQIRERFGPAGLTMTSWGPASAGPCSPSPAALRITDDTQMTLFTAEGLLRSHNEWRACASTNRARAVHRAYLRWLVTQGEQVPDLAARHRRSWLLDQPELHHRRAPGNTCLSALLSGRAGTVAEPINTSKGCGGVMRVAPVGLGCEAAFEAGCEAAALTHGHPSGYLAAGFFAEVVFQLRRGRQLRTAIGRATTELKLHARHGECLDAVREATDFAMLAAPTPENVQRLGAGWVAEEALAIALFCALTARTFADGVLAAVNHSGDSDSTGAMAGNLLGMMHGASAIPETWLERLELCDVISTVGEDLYRHFGSQAREWDDDRERWPAA